MKKVRTEDAVGHVLCHDITQIIPGVIKDAAFRKGHVVTEDDIPVLLSLGKEHLYAWEAAQDMLHENDAAQILYEMCAGEYMRPSSVKEGKIQVIAEQDGLLTVDILKLRAVNSLGEMMIATRHSHFPVKSGDSLAGARVIPLLIERDKMSRACELASGGPILTLRPFRRMRAGLIVTGNEVFHGRIRDAFAPVLMGKLAEYGSEVAFHTLSPDDPEVITAHIKTMLAEGADMIFCTGGMSVDPDDRTPLAIRNASDTVISYGAPVLPGAMFLLAYRGDIPICGLPGCVMYSRRTIFDLALPRLLAGLRITADELAGLGHGGLCLDCETCTYPNCGFGKGV